MNNQSAQVVEKLCSYWGVLYVGGMSYGDTTSSWRISSSLRWSKSGHKQRTTNQTRFPKIQLAELHEQRRDERRRSMGLCACYLQY